MVLILSTRGLPIAGPPPVVEGPQWYVATNGSPSNNGSIVSPWSAAFALNGAGGAILPGDTINFRSGTYGTSSSDWDFATTGTVSSPITWRNYTGETAVFNGRIFSTGSYNRLLGRGLGFIYYNSQPSGRSVNGVVGNNRGVEFINMVIHDAPKSGIGHQNASPDGQVYGCIIYNCGHEFNLDHGIYFQHVTGTVRKRLRENVVFQNLAYNFHGFNGGASPTDLVGCVGFSFGEITAVSSGGEYIIDQDNNDDTTLSRCYSYDIDGGEGSIAQQFGGNGAANRRFRAEDCLFYGGTVIRQTCDTALLAILRNRFYAMNTFQWWIQNATTVAPSWNENRYGERGSSWGSIVRVNSSDLSFSDFGTWQSQHAAVTVPGTTPDTSGSSDYLQSASGEPVSGSFIDVRPNEYEVGRGHIVIYNWDDAANVNVNLSPVLGVGDSFEIRNVQALFTTPSSHIPSTPVVSGVYNGGTVSVPMTVTPLDPLDMVARGLRSPRAVGPRFGTFLILRTS